VPVVASVSPSGGLATGGTSITVSGSGFTGATLVKVGTLNATGVTIVDGSTITCTTPAGTAGLKSISVTTPGGTGTLSNCFTYYAQPTITSVTPAAGPVAGNTSLTINGTNFLGASAVTVGGQPVTGLVITATRITGRTPAGAAGAQDVVVTTPGGTATRSGAFTYHALPTVASVSPSSGSLAGGTTITVTGTNLSGATLVRVGSVNATGLTVVDATTLTCVTPAGAAGAKSVSVTTPGGTATRSNAFTHVYIAPTIASISPASGPESGGTSITITGTNLLGASAVRIGGTLATGLTVVDATTLTCTTPAGTAGARDVQVTVPGGSVTRTGGFTYAAVPSIAGVSPGSGVLSGGATITITGTNLSGASAVTVGGVPATGVTAVNETTVRAVVPASTAGPKAVTVTTPGGLATLAGGFRYAAVREPEWGTVSEALPDPSVITDAALREAIEATGFAWRIVDDATGIEMVLVPAGTFDMGCSPSAAHACAGSELPVHPVTLTGSYYVGRYEVTQSQWTAVMGSNPSLFQGLPDSGVRPVERASWDMMQGFLSATGLRLPTEAEWEYACRAGTETAYHGWPENPLGTDDDAQLGTIAWFGGNAGGQTRPVGLKRPNGFGLFDISGNVYEAVSDRYSDSYYEVSPAVDPPGPSTGDYQVWRGGSWTGFHPCRSSNRDVAAADFVSADLGFRVVRGIGPTISGLSPSGGDAAGGALITISGTRLTGTTAVTVGGVAATSVTVVDDSTVTAVTPAGTAGAQDVTITTPGGTATLTSGFTYVTVPSWATLVEALPDPSVVTDALLRDAIEATGLAWRLQDTGTGIELLLVPPGTFEMGCIMGSNLYGCHEWEQPAHQVTLTNAFYLGRYEVTQSQWTAQMGSNPSNFQSASPEVPADQVPNRPVERVSWDTIQGYLSATGFRLPTEAEWEYACRAGTQTPFYDGSTNDGTLGTLAWYGAFSIADNSFFQTRPVGGKAANAFGFHDMLGNAFEWVNDWYGNYAGEAQTNPAGPVSAPGRVIRGGSFGYDSSATRSTSRFEVTPSVSSTYVGLGFRVARNP
jgi:formylglycine-generating enzyme required for sulfatase activity